MRDALNSLGDVVHNLQRERGCCSMLICSEGKIFAERTKQQFLKTNASLNKLNDDWLSWSEQGALKPHILKNIKSILDKRESLESQREKLFNKKVSASHSIEQYSHQFICPLLQYSIEIALKMEKANPTYVSSFNAFLQWKERIGLERAIGVRGFMGYIFHNSEFIDRLLFLLGEQTNYQNTFMALVNPHQRKIVQEVLNEEVCRKLEHLHDLLRNHPESEELYKLTPEAWFDLITEKIDAMQNIMYQLIDTLIESPEDNEHPRHVQPNDISNTEIAKHALLIDSLNVFSGITKNAFNVLMQQAHIREHNKGKLLFLHGEQANHLYIILDGWVKIYKGTRQGEEVVLQMLSSGDCIMETAVYLNLPFPVSAQIVEHATILSLPAPIVREQIKRNNQLALNTLSSMCYRSQSLISQIEVMRLKTVDERLGWFLLKLVIDQQHKTRTIQLPYEKSVIASYLGMKRETFSRALKRLKTKGFIVENNTVTLPSLTSLCEFCDHSVAENCPRHGTEDCPSPQEHSENIEIISN